MALATDLFPNDTEILIVGASARSAAVSAIRSGLRPTCLDMFADDDLQRISETQRVEDYPRGITSQSERISPCRWIYSGAIENHPDIVARISNRHLLAGNGPDVLNRVRDPFALAKILESSQLPSLRLCRHTAPPDPDGAWLLKSIRSSNGAGVAVWDAATAAATVPDHGHYFQERRQDTVASALFVAARHATFLIGIAEQFIAGSDSPLTEFTFCGAVAPIQVPPNIVATISDVGSKVAQTCGLHGLFGCDFVIDDHTAWLTEVNPRYTATVELYELSHHIPLLRWHLLACDSFGSTRTTLAELESWIASGIQQSCDRFCAKRILYAEHAVTAGSLVEHSRECVDVWRVPMVADIPMVGTVIQPRQPICTVMAEGNTVDGCLEQLTQRVAEVQSCLIAKTGSESLPGV